MAAFAGLVAVTLKTSGVKSTPRKTVFVGAVAIVVAVLPDPVSVTLINKFAVVAVVVA